MKTFAPLEAGALRVVSAGLVLVPIAISLLKQVERKTIPFFIISGLCGVFVPSILFSLAAQHVASALLAALQATVPIYVFIIGLLFYGQKFNWGKLLGISIAGLGMSALLLAGKAGEINFNPWLTVPIFATLLYAINLNILKYHLHKVKSQITASVSVAMVAPPALLVLAFTDAPQDFQQSDDGVISLVAVIALGLFGTALATFLFTRLVQLTSPLFTSSITYFIPMVAVTIGLFDGEVITIPQIAGMVAIIIGVYVLNRSR